MISLAFFNNKGGVGKTSLVYHLAWMYAELGLPVLAADLDPQANLTSMCLDDNRLETLWGDDGRETCGYPWRKTSFRANGPTASIASPEPSGSSRHSGASSDSLPTRAAPALC